MRLSFCFMSVCVVTRKPPWSPLLMGKYGLYRTPEGLRIKKGSLVIRVLYVGYMLWLSYC